jgi:hypothetical protein
MTQAERLARVEEQVNALNKKVDSHDEKFREINGKLDELLELRNKGVGAFWLMSSLIGTGIIGFIAKVTNFFGGQ